jgi:hypothetical protein
MALSECDTWQPLTVTNDRGRAHTWNRMLCGMVLELIGIMTKTTMHMLQSGGVVTHGGVYEVL